MGMDRQWKVRTYAKKIMKFGNQELQQYMRWGEQFDSRLKLDPIQYYLIDNIWNIPTAPEISNYKIAIINVLTNYFLTTIQKPEGKKYSCYSVLSGPQAGVYYNWEEIKAAILGCERPSYRGFYSLNEAFDAVRAKIGPNFFVNTLLKSSGKLQPGKTYLKAATTLEKINLENLSLISAKVAATYEKINSKRILIGQKKNLPEDLSTYIRTLAENSTLQEFMDLCELLSLFHKEPPAGIIIVYEAEFNYMLKCQKKFPTCSTQLILSVDANYYTLSGKLM